MNEVPERKRSVRSFVRRTGRMTPAQQRALSDLWPQFGIEYSPIPLDIQQVFGRSAKLVVEIGFGNGESLIHEARSHPDIDYLGIEVHQPGVGHCLNCAQDSAITNLRVIAHDAIESLQHQIPDRSVSSFNLLFPDPWPKKRHHKRRILQAEFLKLAASKLVASGTLNIATDWVNYAEHIDEIVASSPHFTVSERREHAGDNPLGRQNTKFEQRGMRKGHKIWDWRFTKN